jgi:formylglycine-generating enzyme required for sulfatase activity
MAGNVWEWCQSLEKSYPYHAGDGREDLSSKSPRVLRGGAFDDDGRDMRCACRLGDYPDNWDYSIGFRVVIAPGPSDP